MTADFYEFPWPVLAKTATRTINEVKGVNRVNRVVYDVTSKPPGRLSGNAPNANGRAQIGAGTSRYETGGAGARSQPGRPEY